jgi:protein MpaA
MLALLAALAVSAPAVDHRELIGRSVLGRPIRAIERGDPFAQTRVLVVGCIHGPGEAAGVAITRRLQRMPLPAGVELWIVPDLNPDAIALGTRANADDVNLNRNFASGWHPTAAGGESSGGSRPFSEPETRAARRLILRVGPTVTIWYHQHMNLVWASGPSAAAGSRYAGFTGMRSVHWGWLWGTAPHWQNAALRERSFVVELPPGRLDAAGVARHARAVLRLATS